MATLLPDLPSQLAPEEAELDEENPFENSPIAVEGDEDTLPRNLPKLAALPQIGGEDTTSTNSLVGTPILRKKKRNFYSKPILPSH